MNLFGYTNTVVDVSEPFDDMTLAFEFGHYCALKHTKKKVKLNDVEKISLFFLFNFRSKFVNWGV